MIQTLSRLTWVHEDGQQLCIAEPGHPIRGDMDRDPYGAGVVHRITRTETGAAIFTAGRSQPIQILESQIRYD